MAAGADSTKLLMEIKHGGDSDSYISARARQGLTFDCEALSPLVFGGVGGTGIQSWKKFIYRIGGILEHQRK